MASEASKVDSSCLEKLITTWIFPKRPSKSTFCTWGMEREMSWMGEHDPARPNSHPLPSCNPPALSSPSAPQLGLLPPQ